MTVVQIPPKGIARTTVWLMVATSKPAALAGQPWFRPKRTTHTDVYKVYTQVWVAMRRNTRDKTWAGYAQKPGKADSLGGLPR